MVYQVLYTLTNDSTANRNLVEEAIKARSVGYWAQLSVNCWLVYVHDQNVASFRDGIFGAMHQGDLLFVSRLQGEWGAYSLSDPVVAWLKGVRF